VAGLNTEWAITELRTFVAECQSHTNLWINQHGNSTQKQALHDSIKGRMPIVQQIAVRAWTGGLPQLSKRAPMGWEYEPALDLAQKTLAQLERREELAENLGDVGPAFHAASLHRDVWEAAQAPWRNGHFGDAVRAAARSVNAQLQARVGRRDESEAKLVGECFSMKPPSEGQPRLRLMAADGSDTYRSLHDGAAAFGRGCFMAIRNVLNHEAGPAADPPEQEALEYLAAFSVLARWIERADVQEA
jgi:uncharacterized protein (TIGR02391 family)